jgi:hypothetical protein
MKYSKINKRIWIWILPITILILLVVVIHYAFSIYYNSKEGLITFKKTKYENLPKVVERALNNYFNKNLKTEKVNQYEISSDNNYLKITYNTKMIEYKIINNSKNKLTLERIPKKKKNSKKENFSLIEGLSSPSKSDMIEFAFDDLVLFKDENIFKLDKSDKKYSFMTDPCNPSSFYNNIFNKERGLIYTFIEVFKSSKPSLYISTGATPPKNYENNGEYKKGPLSNLSLDYNGLSENILNMLENTEKAKQKDLSTPGGSLLTPGGSTSTPGGCPEPQAEPLLTPDQIAEKVKLLMNQMILATDYIIDTVLVKSNTTSPYYDYIVKNNNLPLLLENIKKILNKTDKTNKIYIWTNKGSIRI